MREKSDSQDIILKFNQIVVLNSLPESNPKPEGQNPKPETIVYEKPDSTRYPNVQTRPDPKPDKVRPVPALLDLEMTTLDLQMESSMDMLTFLNVFILLRLAILVKLV